VQRSSALIFMTLLALIALSLHFGFGWYAAVDEAEAHGQSADMSAYVIEWARDTFENLQSEFWQLAVQFALLAGLLRWIGVRAYEEDVEDVKKEIAEIKALLMQAGDR